MGSSRCKAIHKARFPHRQNTAPSSTVVSLMDHFKSKFYFILQIK